MWNLALQAWLAQSYRQGVLAATISGEADITVCKKPRVVVAIQPPKGRKHRGVLELSLSLSLSLSILLSLSLPLDLPFLVTVRLVRVVSLTEAATAVEPTTLQVVLV